MERKTKNLSIEIKAVGNDGSIEGYGNVFGNIDSYGDIVERGAFLKTLGERGNKVRMLWQHRSDQPIGVWSSMQEDEVGLRVKGRLLLSVQQGREAYELLKAGAISGLSIGFTPVQQDYDAKTGINRIKEVKLYETSIVTFPANESATVTSVKSAFEELNEEQRIKTLTFINSLRNKSLDDEQSRQSSEASEEKHSELQQADTRNGEPLNTELKHSLERLIQSMTL